MSMKRDNRVAIITDTGVIFTYRQLNQAISESGKLFGHQQKKIVAIICKNTIGCILCYLACMKKKYVPLLVPEDIQNQALESLCQSYKVDYICVPEDKISGIESCGSIHDYCIYTMKQDEQYEEINTDLALLLMTSGSTGNHKCVRISYQNLEDNTKSICEALEIQLDDRAITSLPMNYTYGLSVIHTHLYRGAILLLTNKRIVDFQFWEFFAENKGTTFSGVPFSYECIHKMKIWKKYLKSIRVMTQAGGRLSEELQLFFGRLAEKNDFRMYIMYGQTEATARMSYLPYTDILNKIGSVGIAIPGGTIEIKNKEIVYYGTNVCMGYAFTRDDLTKSDSNGGVLYTRDIGYIREGYLYITGRMGREVKLNGLRVNLDDVENIIKRLIGCQVACIKHDTNLFVYRTKKGVDEYYRGLQSYVAIPRTIVVDICVKELPRLETGKVDYMELIKMAGEGTYDCET